MRQHRTDAVSLVFGLIFLIIAGSWALGSVVNIDLNVPNLGWLVALGLIGLGLLGVVASLRRPGSADPPAVTSPAPTDARAASVPPTESDPTI